MDNKLKVILSDECEKPIRFGFESDKKIIVDGSSLIVERKSTLKELFPWATKAIEYEGDIYILNEEENLCYILEPNAEI